MMMIHDIITALFCQLLILIGAYGSWYSPTSVRRITGIRVHELMMISFGKYQSVNVNHDSYFQGAIWGRSWPEGIRLNNRFSIVYKYDK